MTRPVRAVIDLKALQSNFSLARERAPKARVMAVIKANAYGHGAAEAARALADADAFALASVEEALVLKQAGIQQPLVLLEGIFAPDELEPVAEHRLQMVVHTEEQIAWLEQSTLDAPLYAWVKLDTGMHRLGLPLSEAQDAVARLARLIERRGGALRLMSHLACADEPSNPANDAQLAAFNTLELPGYERSLANSAAILSRPDMQFDWVRPGIMLYGASPFVPGVEAGNGLQAVMSLESRLIAVTGRKRGEGLGYGLTWTCPQDMKVGIVAAGYGDGYPRHAPGGTPVLVNDKVVPLVGRVSMDMLCVDLRQQPDAKAGDPVQLWGRCLPVDAVAAHAGTISYEPLCNVNPRVPREYLNG